MITHLPDWWQLRIIILSELVRNVIFRSKRWLILFWWTFKTLTFLSSIRILLCRIRILLWKFVIILIVSIRILSFLTLHVWFEVILLRFVAILFLVWLIFIRKVVNWRRCELVINFILYSLIKSFIKSFSVFHIHVNSIWISCIFLISCCEVINFWLIFFVWCFRFIVMILCIIQVKITACFFSMISLWWSWVSKSNFLGTKLVIFW